jgi:hypothetical protein
MWILFSILNYLITKKCKIFGKGYAKINEMDNDNNRILASKFYLLTHDIRNSKTLTNENIDFIETLDKDKLIELIKLYP